MLKKAIYGLIAFISFITLYIYWGSQDPTKLDTQGLIEFIPKFNPMENGFKHIRFSQEKSYQSNLQGQTQDLLRKHISAEQWSAKWVEDVLLAHQKEIEVSLIASNSTHFDLEQSYAIEFTTDYIEIMNLGRLLILQSMQLAKQGHYQAALEYTNSAIRFGQLVKTETESILISYMIGIVIQQEALFWQAELIKNHPLSEDNYRQTINTLTAVGKNSQENYARIMSGEFLYSQNFIRELSKGSLIDRWKQYFGERNQLQFLTGDEEQNPLDDIHEFLFITFPSFYFHKNLETNKLAISLKGERQRVLQGCHTVEYKWNDYETNEQQPPKDTTILDLFTPNSMGDKLNSSTQEDVYYDYLMRHCAHQLHLQGNKVIAAANLFRTINGTTIKNLAQLKSYISESDWVDPFSKGPLILENDYKTINSVGYDGKNSPCEKSYLYHKQCYLEDDCFSKPSFTLYSGDRTVN
ncbi:MAG: hypothetical protein OIF51_21075 [Cellvibrionaceae bacterium]|nr:hypothetical protein [Cellvibrionaceae bacterium]